MGGGVGVGVRGERFAFAKTKETRRGDAEGETLRDGTRQAGGAGAVRLLVRCASFRSKARRQFVRIDGHRDWGVVTKEGGREGERGGEGGRREGGREEEREATENAARGQVDAGLGHGRGGRVG